VDDVDDTLDDRDIDGAEKSSSDSPSGVKEGDGDR